ncbi:MAG TPA: hypothetical protein VHU92_18500 [Streptosporangiaceae bacterium]|jgi:hypothetical protein|nr:hypothetical protein [Streptosporangiaceae bacterium]
MTEANIEPSCSRAIRLLVGVLALKNAVQLAAIVFCAPEFPVVPGALDELTGADELAGGVELDEALGLPLLPQAAAPRPSAHARMIRSDLLVTIASNLQLLAARGAQG